MTNKNSFKKILKGISFLILYISVIILTLFEFLWFTYVLTYMKIQPKSIDFALFYFFVPMRTLITAIIILVPDFKAIYNALIICFFMIIEIVWTTFLFFGTNNYMKNYFGSSIFAASALALICNLALLIALILKFYEIYKDIKKTNIQ
ncbi:hypothetical protein [Clostridium sp. DL1XJH146]